MKKSLFGMLVIAVVLVAPEPASACSRVRCTENLAPLGNDAYPAHLPVNGVFVGSPEAAAGSTIAVVIERDGMTLTRTLEPASVVEIPDVEEGDRVRVTIERACGGTTSTVIDVTAFAPVPTVIGTLVVSSSRRTVVEVADLGGACTRDLAVSVAPFSLVLEASAEPWRDAILETVLVDDAPWPDSHDPAVESRFVYGACEEPASTQIPTDLSIGAHRLRIEAGLRGVTPAMATNEVPFELGCEIAPGTDAAVMSDGSMAPAPSASCAVSASRTSLASFAFAASCLAIGVRRRRSRRTASCSASSSV